MVYTSHEPVEWALPGRDLAAVDVVLSVEWIRNNCIYC